MDDDPFELHGDEFHPESPMAASARLRDRLRLIHPQASLIVTGYAALELEVDQVLRRFLSRPSKLPRLTMDHRLGLLRAFIVDEWLDLVLDAIGAFGALRNCVAHGDHADVIDQAISKLGAKTYSIGLPLDANTNLGVVAMNLASSLHAGTEFFECGCRPRS
ncbi:MAG: hypothetical protein WCY11_04275 [Novosphingobium sp.]